MPVVACDYCRQNIEKSDWQIQRGGNLFCDRHCKGKYQNSETIKEFSKRLGVDDLKTHMTELYVNQQMSTRQLMKLFGTGSNRTITKLLKVFEIEIRHGSDAVKTQWENNDERRKMQSEKMREQSTGKPAYNSGQTKEKGGKQALILSATRKGKNNPMYGRRGEKSPCWDPTRTHENRWKQRKTAEYKDWLRSVYERDNFTCQCCGTIGERLNAHHLESYSTNKELRIVVSNGITLCESCHKDFHKVFGNKNNTTEQFCEYMRSKGKGFRPFI